MRNRRCAPSGRGDYWAKAAVLAACQKTMRLRKVTTEDLVPCASQVDLGVSELVRKQEAGWSYIRAGE